MPSNFSSFNTALITGGAGGIGRGLTELFLSKGKKVIIAGRTESKLKETVSQISNDNLSYLVLDTADLASLPSFVENLTSKYPDLDCVVQNAGIQKPLDYKSLLSGSATAKDASKLLAAGDQEVDINIRGVIHLTTLLLPHLASKPSSAILTVSSGLAFVPISPVPVYCATKSFIHSWTISLRKQISDDDSDGSRGIKVIEIAPPLVESDLHRDHDDPDNNKKTKNANAMTMVDFIDAVSKGMESGQDEIGAGFSTMGIKSWRDAFGELWKRMNP